VADFSKLPVGTMMVIRSGIERHRSLRPIEKVLKKHIVCSGVKWQIDGFNSMANAGRWNMATIAVASPDDIAAVEHEQRVYALKNVKWADLKPDLVQIIYGMVKEATK